MLEDSELFDYDELVEEENTEGGHEENNNPQGEPGEKDRNLSADHFGVDGEGKKSKSEEKKRNSSSQSKRPPPPSSSPTASNRSSSKKSSHSSTTHTSTKSRFPITRSSSRRHDGEKKKEGKKVSEKHFASPPANYSFQNLHPPSPTSSTSASTSQTSFTPMPSSTPSPSTLMRGEADRKRRSGAPSPKPAPASSPARSYRSPNPTIDYRQHSSNHRHHQPHQQRRRPDSLTSSFHHHHHNQDEKSPHHRWRDGGGGGRSVESRLEESVGRKRSEARRRREDEEGKDGSSRRKREKEAGGGKRKLNADEILDSLYRDVQNNPEPVDIHNMISQANNTQALEERLSHLRGEALHKRETEGKKEDGEKDARKRRKSHSSSRSSSKKARKTDKEEDSKGSNNNRSKHHHREKRKKSPSTKRNKKRDEEEGGDEEIDPTIPAVDMQELLPQSSTTMQVVHETHAGPSKRIRLEYDVDNGPKASASKKKEEEDKKSEAKGQESSPQPNCPTVEVDTKNPAAPQEPIFKIRIGKLSGDEEEEVFPLVKERKTLSQTTTTTTTTSATNKPPPTTKTMSLDQRARALGMGGGGGGGLGAVLSGGANPFAGFSFTPFNATQPAGERSSDGSVTATEGSKGALNGNTSIAPSAPAASAGSGQEKAVESGTSGANNPFAGFFFTPADASSTATTTSAPTVPTVSPGGAGASHQQEDNEKAEKSSSLKENEASSSSSPSVTAITTGQEAASSKNTRTDLIEKSGSNSRVDDTGGSEGRAKNNLAPWPLPAAAPSTVPPPPQQPRQLFPLKPIPPLLNPATIALLPRNVNISIQLKTKALPCEGGDGDDDEGENDGDSGHEDGEGESTTPSKRKSRHHHHNSKERSKSSRLTAAMEEGGHAEEGKIGIGAGGAVGGGVSEWRQNSEGLIRDPSAKYFSSGSGGKDRREDEEENGGKRKKRSKEKDDKKGKKKNEKGKAKSKEKSSSSGGSSSKKEKKKERTPSIHDHLANSPSSTSTASPSRHRRRRDSSDDGEREEERYREREREKRGDVGHHRKDGWDESRRDSYGRRYEGGHGRDDDWRQHSNRSRNRSCSPPRRSNYPARGKSRDDLPYRSSRAPHSSNYHQASYRYRNGRLRRSSSPWERFRKEDYMDEEGRIDKQKLLEIATRNATKMAMEGKLPKGAELFHTMKNKSIDQLVGLCQQLQADHDRMESVSSDEEERYGKRYEKWRQSSLNSGRAGSEERREFASHPVRDHPIRIKLNSAAVQATERKEKEENLRLTFPVSSGARHRKDAEEKRGESEWVPVVKASDCRELVPIGPLTSALSRIKTNIQTPFTQLKAKQGGGTINKPTATAADKDVPPTEQPQQPSYPPVVPQLSQPPVPPLLVNSAVANSLGAQYLANRTLKPLPQDSQPLPLATLRRQLEMMPPPPPPPPPLPLYSAVESSPPVFFPRGGGGGGGSSALSPVGQQCSQPPIAPPSLAHLPDTYLPPLAYPAPSIYSQPQQPSSSYANASVNSNSYTYSAQQASYALTAPSFVPSTDPYSSMSPSSSSSSSITPSAAQQPAHTPPKVVLGSWDKPGRLVLQEALETAKRQQQQEREAAAEAEAQARREEAYGARKPPRSILSGVPLLSGQLASSSIPISLPPPPVPPPSVSTAAIVSRQRPQQAPPQQQQQQTHTRVGSTIVVDTGGGLEDVLAAVDRAMERMGNRGDTGEEEGVVENANGKISSKEGPPQKEAFGLVSAMKDSGDVGTSSSVGDALIKGNTYGVVERLEPSPSSLTGSKLDEVPLAKAADEKSSASNVGMEPPTTQNSIPSCAGKPNDSAAMPTEVPSTASAIAPPGTAELGHEHQKGVPLVIMSTTPTATEPLGVVGEDGERKSQKEPVLVPTPSSASVDSALRGDKTGGVNEDIEASLPASGGGPVEIAGGSSTAVVAPSGTRLVEETFSSTKQTPSTEVALSTPLQPIPSTPMGCASTQHAESAEKASVGEDEPQSVHSTSVGDKKGKLADYSYASIAAKVDAAIAAQASCFQSTSAENIGPQLPISEIIASLQARSDFASKARSSAPIPSEVAALPAYSVFPALPPSTSTRPLTEATRTVADLLTERLMYAQLLKDNPNDYNARKQLAKIDEEMSEWAMKSNLPGQFTGSNCSTGARMLSQRQLEPHDPRYNAWARKEQLKNAPEVSSEIGMRLLQRMGWQPGEGLGRSSDGPLEPLMLDVKNDRKGLQCFEETSRGQRLSALTSTGKNPISTLMEVCALNRWPLPLFECNKIGRDNDPRFIWKAQLNGVEYSSSVPASNKKVGKQQVCQVVLEALGIGLGGGGGAS